MTDEERLDELSKAIAAEENSPLQPAVVARAFLDPGAPLVFGVRLPQVTLLAWLRLEAAHSPFVTGEYVGDAAERVQALCTAWEAIVGEPLFPEAIIGAVPPEDVLAAEAAIARRVNECFDTFLPLRLPGAKTVEQPRDAGTGWWVRILARLCNGFHMTLEDALDTPLIQAFALLAGHGANDGQEPAGMTWAEREAMRKAAVSALGAAVTVNDGKDIKRDRRKNQRAEESNKSHKDETPLGATSPHLVEPGQKEVHSGVEASHGRKMA